MRSPNTPCPMCISPAMRAELDECPLCGAPIFGVVLIAGGFIPEVITAKRLILLALKGTAVNAAPQAPPLANWR